MLPFIYLLDSKIPTYSLLTLCGLILAGFFICTRASKVGIPLYNSVMTLLFVGMGMAVGGCVLYGLTNIKVLINLIRTIGNYSFDQIVGVVMMAFGGSVFYGGLIGGTIFGMIYVKHAKLPLGTFCDFVAPGAALFHGFGRIGCFLAGCCYGAECDFGFIMTKSEVLNANGVRRFPVQLVESAFEFVLFFVLWFLLSKGLLKKRLLPLYFMIYPIGRFTLEFFRGDLHRGIWFGFSTSQWISMALFTVATIVMITTTLSKSNKKEVIQE